MAQARVQTQAEDGHGGPADGGTEDEGGGGGKPDELLDAVRRRLRQPNLCMRLQCHWLRSVIPNG